MVRKICTDCEYPESACLCSRVQSQTLPLRIIIVQDRQEQRASKSTVPLLRLALPAVELVAGNDAPALLALQASHARAEVSWGLLYPGDEAIAVDTAPVSPNHTANPADWPTTWVIPDGTWRKTRRLLQEQPWIGAMTGYSFSRPPASRYLIRKGPGQGALSTLESVAWLLCNITSVDPAPLYRLQAAFVAQRQAHQPAAHRRSEAGAEAGRTGRGSARA